MNTHGRSRWMACAALSLLMASTAMAQRTSPVGRWKTVDDSTGAVRSVVEIFERDGALFGRVAEVFDPKERNRVCEACAKDDPRRDQPILGMEVLRSMVRNGDVWEGGDILDPENGKVYRSKIWHEDGKLRLRGYIAFLFRTQTWLPAD